MTIWQLLAPIANAFRPGPSPFKHGGRVGGKALQQALAARVVRPRHATRRPVRPYNPVPLRPNMGPFNGHPF